MRNNFCLSFVFVGLLSSKLSGAAVTVTVQEVGANVVFTASGSLNLTGLTFAGTSTRYSFISPAAGELWIGPTSSLNDTYTGASGFTAYGTTGLINPTSTSGVFFGLTASGTVHLPAGYTSGASINSSSTFAGSLSSLGLTPGAYISSWSGDFITVIIGPPTVTSISPTSGSTAGGTTITITGTNFTGATGITVGGAACTAFNVASATSATCTTPAGAAGTASVVVTTGGGSNAANTLFTYTAAPSAVPTLSEWSQMLLGLFVMTLLGWHFNRRQSF